MSLFCKAGLLGWDYGSCRADWPRWSPCCISTGTSAFHASLVHNLYWISAGPVEKQTMVMMSVGRGHQSWLDKGPEVAVKGMTGIVTAVNANTQTQCSRQHPSAPLPYLSRLAALCLPAPLCWRWPFFSQRHGARRPVKWKSSSLLSALTQCAEKYTPT